jgi:hypothetical protein
MSVVVVKTVTNTVSKTATDIANGLGKQIVSAIEGASREGAKAARQVIVDAGRVDTGRMRDSTVEFPAVETPKGAEGGFHCRVPYAIYNEYGTVNMSAIHFMERGAAKARTELRERLGKITGGGSK